MLRQVILSILFLVATYLVYQTPTYKPWYEGRILRYYTNIQQFIDVPEYTNLDIRMKTRYGGKIDFYKRIKETLQNNTQGRPFSEQFLLIPPHSYLIEAGFDFKFDEPAVVYLLSRGLQVVLPYSVNAQKANWVFVVAEKQPRIEKIESDETRVNFIELYKKYPFSL